MNRRVLLFAAALAACRAPIPQTGTRVPFEQLRDRRADLDTLIATEIAANRPRRAYYVLDVRKTRPYALQQLAGGTRADSVEGDLRSLFAGLVASARDPSRSAPVARSAVDAEKTEDADDDRYWQHLGRFERRINALNVETPGIPYSYAARRSFGVSSMEETALLFTSDEAFLSYFVHGEETYLFVIRQNRLVVHKLPVANSSLREEVTALLAAVRNPRDAQGWKRPAAALYDALLAPAAAELQGARALYISPDSFLAGVPFAVLRGPSAGPDRAPVLTTHRLSYLPSASVYRQLLTHPILDEAPRMLSVGNALYPDGLGPLASAEREAVTVSEVFPGSRLLLGGEAAESAVALLAPRYNVLHFATHGVLLGAYRRGASSLVLTPDAGSDGFLSAREIASLDLGGLYVAVLSACETAVPGDSTAGVDLGTLTNAFLSAGAPSVVGSMWQIHDAATTLLMLEFYRSFLEVGPGEALRQAMLALRAREDFSHPFFWGAFVLYGWDK